MSSIPTLSIILGEALLSLYPILVKTVKSDLLTHTAVRLITAIVICYPFISTPISQITGQLPYLLISLLYVIHIYASYLGFRNLEVGVAITLFYTYPLINVLINQIFIANKVNIEVIYYFLISFAGVILISKAGSGTSIEKAHFNIPLGLTAVMISALTESLIYIFYKTGQDTNPFNMLFTLCFAGAILLSCVWLYQNYNTISTMTTVTPEQINISTKLILANALLGVGGYLLRFYNIPKVTTEWFSILSFSGIIFGYVYGWNFFNEKINLAKVIGTLMIMYSVYQVKILGF